MKTALVTGAATGIGAAIAERFLKAGYQVALFDIDGPAAAATASRIDSDTKKLVRGPFHVCNPPVSALSPPQL